MVAALELGYRRGDGGAFLSARAKPPLPLEVPGPALAAGARVDYYVRALNAHGSVLAESGTPTLPFRLQVAAPAAWPPAWRRRARRHPGSGTGGSGPSSARSPSAPARITYAETRPESLLTIHAGTNN